MIAEFVQILILNMNNNNRNVRIIVEQRNKSERHRDWLEESKGVYDIAKETEKFVRYC